MRGLLPPPVLRQAPRRRRGAEEGQGTADGPIHLSDAEALFLIWDNIWSGILFAVPAMLTVLKHGRESHSGEEEELLEEGRRGGGGGGGGHRQAGRQVTAAQLQLQGGAAACAQD